MSDVTETQRTWLDRLVDALATRAGTIVALGVILSVCVVAGLQVIQSARQLEIEHATFRDRQIRNGYVAMSDVQRLVLITQQAAHEDSMTDRLAQDFRQATDMIFVRIDNFDRMMAQDDAPMSGAVSIAALRDVLHIAEDAIAAGFPDPDVLLSDLLQAAGLARRHLVLFLDDMRRLADQVLEDQSHVVQTQKFVVLATLAGLTVFGSIAVLFLRREVKGRRAREKAERRVAYLAYYDTLTGLPNRAQFQTKLESLLQARSDIALMIVDLDGFKTINDTYGHAAGDALLTAVAERLAALSGRQSGFAARLGGDEFAVVVQTDDLAALEALCAEIREISRNRFVFDGVAFEFGMSIGLSTAAAAAGSWPVTLDQLTRVTDFALYEAKQQGKGGYCIYDAAIKQKFATRKEMIEALPKAISEGELEIYLQPKVDLPLGTVRGFEALVRWRRGADLIPPSDFILVAEESGLVLEIDRYVLRTAVSLMATWQADVSEELSVSVNLSTQHFGSDRIVADVAQVLRDTGLAPHLLTLEITETTELRDWKTADPVLRGLKALGVRISIDDFGTGYSSLAYLQSTMADELKVDRSLVQKIEQSDKACLLLHSVLDIARNLDLAVVVEGVETEGQAQLLADMGVSCAQGFLYGRPVPAREALHAALAASVAVRRYAS